MRKMMVRNLGSNPSQHMVIKTPEGVWDLGTVLSGAGVRARWSQQRFARRRKAYMRERAARLNGNRRVEFLKLMEEINA